MADTDDFKIKGAAQKSEMARAASEEGEGDNKQSSEKAAQADDQKSQIAEEKQDEPHRPTDEEQFRWYKCETVVEGQTYPYWIHGDTKESRWEEPHEPYFIWDPISQGPDKSGLHVPAHLPTETKENVSNALDVTQEYIPYDPKIHGSYDENAPYAQYFKAKWAENDAINNPTPVGSSKVAYTSALATNRRTGKVAAPPDAKNPEYLSAAAKSGRQLNGYFDPDAHANSHDGRSLKEERRQLKFSKREIKEFREKRKERKVEKRRAFLTS